MNIRIEDILINKEIRKRLQGLMEAGKMEKVITKYHIVSYIYMYKMCMILELFLQCRFCLEMKSAKQFSFNVYISR